MKALMCALAVLTLFLAGCAGGGGVLPDGHPPGEGLRFEPLTLDPFAPDQGAALRFRLTRLDGSPAPGRVVRLTAPEFLELEEGSGYKATTGADGSVTFHVRPGAPEGPALVSVRDIASGLEFGMPVSVSPLQPAISGAEARREVERLYPDAANKRLHGPMLLPAGFSLWGRDSTFGPPALSSRAVGPQWVFWYDEHVNARFEHPVKWITLDASDSVGDLSAKLQVSEQMWFPSVLTPESRRYALVPGEWTQRSQEPRQGRTATRGRAPPDACALVFSGPNLPGAGKDMQLFIEYLLRNDLVLRENIHVFWAPVTPEQLNAAIDAIKAKGCKKLYVYYTGHATRNGAMALEDLQGNPAPYFYDTLARRLVGIPDLRVLIDACYSGVAVQAFQNLGLSGVIATSASGSSTALSTWDGGSESMVGAYTRAFTTSDKENWQEAASWVYDQFPNSPATAGQPVFAWIGDTDALALVLPDVLIGGPGETAVVTIQRPAGLDLRHYLELALTIDDPTTAAFTQGGVSTTVLMPNHAMTATVEILGKQSGETRYRAVGRAGTGQRYAGTATVTVGADGYEFEPDALSLRVGDGQTVLLHRRGGSGTTTVSISVGNAALAEVDRVVVPVGSAPAEVRVTAKAAGTTVIRATDTMTGQKAELTVTVSN
jgi:hypothetical protein